MQKTIQKLEQIYHFFNSHVNKAKWNICLDSEANFAERYLDTQGNTCRYTIPNSTSFNMSDFDQIRISLFTILICLLFFQDIFVI